MDFHKFFIKVINTHDTVIPVAAQFSRKKMNLVAKEILEVRRASLRDSVTDAFVPVVEKLV
jgi:hypothetical protein